MEADEGQGVEKGSAAIHISPGGAVVRFPDLANASLVGATRHGLWLSTGHWGADADNPTDWLIDRELLVLNEDGGIHQMTLDRVPAVASDDGGTPRLVVYASAPDALHDGDGGVWYTYRYLHVDLPRNDLPATLRVADYPTTTLNEEEIPEMMDEDGPRTYPSTPDDARAPWDMVALLAEQRQAAIDAVCGEFTNVDSYWEAPGGYMKPLTDGMSDARVMVADDWPDTRVEVSFKHPHYPNGRLRRTFRVFDDAGRITPTQFATISLMEDLDTGALPPARNARDGILEI
ncbi:hypothetical protein [Arthrobacter sp. CAN_A1]|uniref:hypothetical protein n=1 Tax=Arthrobacter sp. CAN_A1 TaxID=2787717 RepID=UPI0018CB908B